jgi:hypothetical protein
MILHRALLVPVVLLATHPGHAQQQPASDAVIIGAAAAIIRSAEACAAVWPGYWYAGKPFGFSREADSAIFVYVPEPPPRPYNLVRARNTPAGLYSRHGYPEGFGGIALDFRVSDQTLPVVHAYTPVQHDVIELLFHEAFHANQWEHFTAVPGGRPAFGSPAARVELAGTTEAFEALATAERQALKAALSARGDALRAWVRAYLALRSRRAALSPAVQDVERYEEQTEGTAEYVGQLCTAHAIGAGPERASARIGAQLAADRPALLGGRPSKWRAYAVGAAMGLLLDQLGADGWRTAAAAGVPLDVLLQRAVDAAPMTDS